MLIRFAHWAFLVAFVASACSAQNAPADTYLATFATAVYEDGYGHGFYSYSPQAGARVRQILGVDAAVELNLVSAPEGERIDIPGILTNTGNGLDGFTLTVPTPPAGWKVFIINDENEDGIRQSNEWLPLYDTGLLDRGQSKRFFVRYEPPWGDVPTDGVTDVFTVASKGGTGGVVTMSTPRWDQLLILGRHAGMWQDWTMTTSEPLMAGPAGDDDKAYYVSAEGTLLMIEIDPWQGYWDRVQTSDQYQGCGAITDDCIMWVTVDGKLATFNKLTKQRIRTISAPSGALFHPNPIVYGSNAIAVSTGGRLHSISRDGVVVLSSNPLGREITTQPLLVGNCLLVGTEGGEVACFDAYSLSLRWTDPVSPGVPLVGKLDGAADGKTLLLTSADNTVRGYSMVSRSVRWSLDLGSEVVGTGYAPQGSAFFLTKDRVLYGLHGYSGAALPGYPFVLPEGEPLTVGMRIFSRDVKGATPYAWFATSENRLYVVNTNNGLTWYYYDLPQAGNFIGEPAFASGNIITAVDSGWAYGFDPK